VSSESSAASAPVRPARTAAAEHAERPATDAAVLERDSDASTRERVLELVVAQGPVSITALAEQLHLTPAAIRRHVAALETSGRVEPRDEPERSGRRGRPARTYVATTRGQEELPSGYEDLAAQALDYLGRTAGAQAVVDFAQQRLAGLEERYATVVTGEDVTERVTQLADALSRDGYVASVRPVPGAIAVQLCQGHCPVQHVAEAFPQLCEAESQVFSRLIGTHTQRLVTLANGGHVCTTNIPVALPDPAVPGTASSEDEPAGSDPPAPPATDPTTLAADSAATAATTAVEGQP